MAAICFVAISTDAQEAGGADRLRQRALELANAARIEAGLPELTLSAALNDAAQSHAEDMVDRDYYAHVSPDGRTPRERFRAAGGGRWAISGENIAKCSGCAPPPDAERIAAFHSGWMQSPGHRENILSRGFDRFGFGIASAASEIYAVQTFSGPGPEGDTPALDAAQARAAAREAMNARRESAGLGPLQPSDALDAVADRVRALLASGKGIPKDIFALLPEGSEGWTSIAIRTASRGGSGATLTRDDVMEIIREWAGGGADAPLGGAPASDLGFAAAAQEDGRLAAVAVFGGRE
jgi:uncharacterized protein YkwD